MQPGAMIWGYANAQTFLNWQILCAKLKRLMLSLRRELLHAFSWLSGIYGA
jgi:hypothetical protein